jgi:hypothetical protein
MRADAERHFASNHGKAMLYGGMFLPPAAWMLHLTASYALAVRLCDGRHYWTLHLVLAVALMVVAAGGFLAWRGWQDTGARVGGDDVGIIARSNFLATAGLASTVFFGLTIVLSEVANWFLPPCIPG